MSAVTSCRNLVHSDFVNKPGILLLATVFSLLFTSRFTKSTLKILYSCPGGIQGLAFWPLYLVALLDHGLYCLNYGFCSLSWFGLAVSLFKLQFVAAKLTLLRIYLALL